MNTIIIFNEHVKVKRHLKMWSHDVIYYINHIQSKRWCYSYHVEIVFLGSDKNSSVSCLKPIYLLLPSRTSLAWIYLHLLIFYSLSPHVRVTFNGFLSAKKHDVEYLSHRWHSWCPGGASFRPARSSLESFIPFCVPRKATYRQCCTD